MSSRPVMPSLPISRRHLLAGGAALTTWGLLPVRSSLAAARDPRFLLVVLRGGLDGLAAVPPVGDPDFARLRQPFIEDAAKAGEPHRLDATFGLHPALKTLAELWDKRQAVVAHAIATPYRERSHFDGQEVLESGLPKPRQAEVGWLNRALAGLEGRERAAAATERGLAIGAIVPLVMRGPAPVLSWSPQHLPEASEDTIQRLLALYDARDPLLATALRRGVQIGKEARGFDRSMANRGAGPQAVLAMAEGAARLLAKPDGPRIGTLSIDGWDTHADQKPGSGRLARLLGTLDALIAGLAQGLAPVWSDTAIAIVTEFGRTVRINGTEGTDHGTATVAFLIGGAVRGGRLIADWPGLGDGALYEGRDLRPTTDLRALMKGVLVEHLGIDARRAGADIFPDSAGLAPIVGLIA